MPDVALHLLVILLIGLPVVEVTARRLRRLAINGNVYRSIALLVHLAAFSLAELMVLAVGTVFVVSICAILLVYAVYEVVTSRSPEAFAARQDHMQQAIWEAAWRIRRQRLARRSMVVVATYKDAHAHELMRRDGQRLQDAGIPFQQHYVLMGSTLVPPEYQQEASRLLSQDITDMQR